MKQRNTEQIAKKLWRLWLITYIVFALIMGMYNTKMMLETGVYAQEFLSVPHLITLSTVILYFGPLICAVRHYAKTALMKKLTICSTVLCSIILLWTILSIIAILIIALQ